jgi:glycosyltransferase involved in cell wall biosynthesis
MEHPALLAICTLPAWPVANGYSLRVYNLLRELAAGWRITLVAPPGPVPGVAEHVEIGLSGPGLTYPWRFDDAPLRGAVERAVAARRFQRALVWPGAEALWFRQSGLPLALMDMIDCNPLEFWRGAWTGPVRERLRSLRELGTAAAYARRTVRSFAATTCVGEQDAAWMRRIGGRDTVHIVPNGVALPDAAGPADEAPTVSFTGTLDYPPNVDAVAYLARAIWPEVRSAVPGARLLIAGRHPVPAIVALHGADGIEVLADVADMAAVIGRSWVSVAPMRIGVGIKNKVLEAWACGRPVVMTGLATNGLTLPPGHAGLVQTDAFAVAGAVVRLLRDQRECRELGEAARRHAGERFSWRAAAERMDGLLRREAGCASLSRPTRVRGFSRR